jgi:hypothetical protein
VVPVLSKPDHRGRGRREKHVTGGRHRHQDR